MLALLPRVHSFPVYPLLHTLVSFRRNIICFTLRQGKSDPFITIKYGSGKEKYRSKVIYNTLSPVWNETCRLPLPDEDHKMIIVS